MGTETALWENFGNLKLYFSCLKSRYACSSKFPIQDMFCDGTNSLLCQTLFQETKNQVSMRCPESAVTFSTKKFPGNSRRKHILLSIGPWSRMAAIKFRERIITLQAWKVFLQALYSTCGCSPRWYFISYKNWKFLGYGFEDVSAFKSSSTKRLTSKSIWHWLR